MIYRRSVLFRLGSDPVVRLWSGFGDLPIPANAHDDATEIYRGAGALLQVPAVKQLINGVADRVDFTLSGVNAATIALAIEDRDTVQGAAVALGYASFDDAWQVETVAWQWLGIADVLKVESNATQDQRTRSITLSVAASDTARANPQLAWFTDADQRRRSPTDAFFSHVAGISQGTTRRWGPK